MSAIIIYSKKWTNWPCLHFNSLQKQCIMLYYKLEVVNVKSLTLYFYKRMYQSKN